MFIENHSDIDTNQFWLRTVVKVAIALLVYPLTLLKNINQLSKVANISGVLIAIYSITIVVYYFKAVANGNNLCSFDE